MSSRRMLPGALVIPLLLAACSVAGSSPTGSGPTGSTPAGSGPADTPAPSGISYPTGTDDLVLRLRYVGGFAPPSARLVDLPAVSVYGDGTVIVPGAVPAIFPGPALPNLQQATITPTGMQLLLAAARDAGLLGRDVHYDLGGIMDASSAEFTLNAEGGVHTVSAYALMEGEETPQGPDAAIAEARARLARLQTQLGNLDGLLGGELGAWSLYRVKVIQLLVSPGTPDAQGLAQEAIAWPLSTPLATFGAALPELFQGQRCGVVAAADVEALRPLLESANALTPWTDDGAAFGIIVRPLLPSETGCQLPAS